MSSTNQGPEYFAAEKHYLNSQTIKDKIYWLEEMIKNFKKHKGSEKMLAELKTRLIKFHEKQEKSKRVGKSNTKSIKKEDLQAVIVGFSNTGKSTLLSSLTKTKPEIASYSYTTKHPLVGMTDFHGAKIQMIEIPAIGSEYYDRGLANNADVLLILVDNLKQIEEAQPLLSKTIGKKLIVFNKIDLLNESEKRKIESTLKSKKYNALLISAKTKEGLDLLKEKIFQSFGKIRIFTKEPGQEKSTNPLILKPESTVKEIAIKIFRDLSHVKETKIWGPSSKFPGQIVGLLHKLKDMDVVEFKTK
jgi:hypothetical protein